MTGRCVEQKEGCNPKARPSHHEARPTLGAGGLRGKRTPSVCARQIIGNGRFQGGKLSRLAPQLSAFLTSCSTACSSSKTCSHESSCSVCVSRNVARSVLRHGLRPGRASSLARRAAPAGKCALSRRSLRPRRDAPSPRIRLATHRVRSAAWLRNVAPRAAVPCVVCETVGVEAQPFLCVGRLGVLQSYRFHLATADRQSSVLRQHPL